MNGEEELPLICVSVELPLGGPQFRDPYLSGGRQGGKRAMDGLSDGIALVFSCLGLPAFERDMGEYTLVIRDKLLTGLPEKWVWAKIEKSQIHMEVKLSLGIRGASWLNKGRIKNFVAGLLASEAGRNGWMRQTGTEDRVDTIDVWVDRCTQLGGHKYVVLGVARIDPHLTARVDQLRAEGKGVVLVTGNDSTILKPKGVTLIRAPELFE